MKVVSLSIRDFALPVPRLGSIEAHSGFARAKEEGQEIHLRVQAKRVAEHPDYRPEEKIAREFERGGYVFRVGGRMDGFWDTDPPRIEEIKSSFKLGELSYKLEYEPESHPYCLQLRTYGYFHWLDTGREAALNFHLVSTRGFDDTRDIELELDREGYERWLDLRLDELVEEARAAEKRSERRRKLAQGLQFPFERPRPGQVELIATVERGFAENKRLMLQAPTGLGKTVGVLYPALKDALSRGQQVIYVTPKNSQHEVAEDAIDRLKEAGSRVKSVTITAKGKICFQGEPVCDPERCKFALDHYTKVGRGDLAEKIFKKRKLTAKYFRGLAEEHECCPFEIQLDALKEADVVICDYNYVFSPRGGLAFQPVVALDLQGKPNLVIDEAHNLPARAMDYYSPELSGEVLERLRPYLQALPKRFAGEAEGLLNDCLEVLRGCKPPSGASGPSRDGAVKIDPSEADFLAQDAELRAFLSRYLESDVKIEAGDPVLKLCFGWGEFTEALSLLDEHEEFFATFRPHPTGGSVRITCCDASKFLAEGFKEFEQVVAFSATLKPFDHYASLSGLDREGPDRLLTAEFSSPFPREHRRIIAIPQVSTKYSERERSAPRIADAITRIVSVRPGNYFAFFPSFVFMERVLAEMKGPSGFSILSQPRDARALDTTAIIERLRAAGEPTLVFAVQGGVLSEGVDYPGESVVGAFIVGPPLPNFDLEHELMRAYYERRYGQGQGFDRAYVYPAMAKAIQAAGRVIRSEQDRGLIVLIDDRFMQPSYARAMPGDWFRESPRELATHGILADVAGFWSGGAESDLEDPTVR